MDFKQFLESKNPEELNTTLHKLPPKVRNLIKGYKISFIPESTLKNDKKHVGIVDKDKKSIIISAGWNYSREMELLHEIGHLIWEELLTNQQKKEWINIAKNTKEKQNQNAEELWCFAFANHFTHMKVDIHTHTTWDNFVKKVL